MGGKKSLSALRLLDANFNRAREGLRIVEDTARFVLNHAAGAKAFRQLRHRLDALTRGHYPELLAARNIEKDSGKKNSSTVYENGVRDLLIANMKRCEEALRVIEEYGRVLSPGTVSQAQAIRFDVYRWEKRLCR